MSLKIKRVTHEEREEWARDHSEPSSKIMKENDVFQFGKHKGKTLKEVMKRDRGYVHWCIREGIFELEESYD